MVFGLAVGAVAKHLMPEEVARRRHRPDSAEPSAGVRKVSPSNFRTRTVGIHLAIGGLRLAR